MGEDVRWRGEILGCPYLCIMCGRGCTLEGGNPGVSLPLHCVGEDVHWSLQRCAKPVNDSVKQCFSGVQQVWFVINCMYSAYVTGVRVGLGVMGGYIGGLKEFFLGSIGVWILGVEAMETQWGFHWYQGTSVLVDKELSH